MALLRLFLISNLPLYTLTSVFHPFTIKNYSIRSENKYFEGYTTGWLECMVICQYDKQCSAYSYKHKKHRNHGVCQLSACFTPLGEAKKVLLYSKRHLYHQLKRKGHWPCTKKNPHVFTCPSVCCKQEWKPFGSNCYKFYEDGRSWQNAERVCSQIAGGHLASIHSQEENDFLNVLANETVKSSTYIWVGLKEIENDSMFVWSDGSFVVNGYRRWEPRQPDHQLECGNMNKYDGYWYDFMCTKENSFLCKYRP